MPLFDEDGKIYALTPNEVRERSVEPNLPPINAGAKVGMREQIYEYHPIHDILCNEVWTLKGGEKLILPACATDLAKRRAKGHAGQ